MWLLEIEFIPPEKIFYILRDREYFFFLDSVIPSYGRYSIMGFEPFLIFRSKKNKIFIEYENKKEEYSGNPFVFLEEILKNYKIDSSYFFIPGGIGYLGYDAGWYIEDLPDLKPDKIQIPDIFFCFYKFIIVFDIKKRKIILTGICKKEKVMEEIEKIKKEVELLPSENREIIVERFSSNMSFQSYIQAIKKIKEYIKSGDVYQINFSHRFEAEGVFPPCKIYLKLRNINPTGYSAYFNFGNFKILSNSPELFIKKWGRKVITKPMKGTSPRGKTRKEDIENRIKLLNSEKDRAELIMIVDLERNDLGKICEFGSVKVNKLINLEKYQTVFQTTSTIQGFLKKNISPIEVIKATFPGGSITGAPKIRAMEIIEELEVDKRSFYTGCLGYIGFNENMIFNIMIRTILLKENKLYYPVGGGIVWDSIAEKEYEETFTKAKNLFLTIGEENEGNLYL